MASSTKAPVRRARSLKRLCYSTEILLQFRPGFGRGEWIIRNATDGETLGRNPNLYMAARRALKAVAP